MPQKDKKLEILVLSNFPTFRKTVAGKQKSNYLLKVEIDIICNKTCLKCQIIV